MNKGIVFDIRRFSVNDGPGIRTTVFLKGCPLHCWWCHNPESRHPGIESCLKPMFLEGKRYDLTEEIGQEMSVDEVMKEIRRDVIFYGTSGGGVTFSGGEPMMQPDFLMSIMEICRKEDIGTVIDTSGYCSSEILEKMIPLATHFLYDIKIINDEDHIKYTNVSNRIILQNLLLLIGKGSSIFIRIPLIPGITDTQANISGIIDFLLPHKDRIRSVSLLPWHLLGNNKYVKLGIENRMEGAEGYDSRLKDSIISDFRQKGFQVL